MKFKLIPFMMMLSSTTIAQSNFEKRELVIPKEGKECLFDIPKGIYTYEVILSNKEIYKKGEYKFLEELTMVIKE